MGGDTNKFMYFLGAILSFLITQNHKCLPNGLPGTFTKS